MQTISREIGVQLIINKTKCILITQTAFLSPFSFLLNPNTPNLAPHQLLTFTMKPIPNATTELTDNATIADKIIN